MHIQTLGILILALMTLPSHARSTAGFCPLNQPCRVDAHDIHPTQFVVGMREIEARVPKYQKMKPKKLENEIASHPSPAIRGPDGLLYIVDHHHLAYILIAMDQPAMYVIVTEDWTGRDQNEFETYMAGNATDLSKNHAYLYDQNNQLRPFADLPRHIDELVDDPYRSLAYFVERHDCINDPQQNYAEFAWARFFRRSIRVEEVSTNFAKAIDDACDLAQSQAARDSHLPGVK